MSTITITLNSVNKEERHLGKMFLNNDYVFCSLDCSRQCLGFDGKPEKNL